ncbi:high affinity sulfate permease [Suhomyces tanzawaensis NRRL Y-17324]|uniref:High affinity sulfate permease n=1 Tax=Suhomyces tanzawaensis NRRL Y-17324 TaxID=984487 RepID=A0A1E4SFX0_9ASCO|nr:high affinity sulfate permease [Suhomyces tanzawaensis NRRL Y-17324]ODV78376.1 high affinity sulfate permease [Suhomyces tanzawaensis NRRL Y-17324]
MSEIIHHLNSNNPPQSEIPEWPEHGELSPVRTNKTSHQFGHDYLPQANHDTVVPEYLEHDVTVVDWGRKVVGNPVQKAIHYLVSLFPIAQWILHYNYKWLYGDLVAGITVGVVLVPQSMSYAQLAALPAQYGLYSSFVGVFIYSFFATSKDVSIGPVAVMSLQVSKVIYRVQQKAGEQFSAPEIATFLSLICGGIAAGIGILRLGFILEFISSPAVMGFMSGSAFSIIVGQVPGLMGFNSKVNTRTATYLVVVNTLKNLKHTNVDAAFGLVPLFILYVWKFGCDYGQKRAPKLKWYFFYVQQLRNAIVIIVATAISWGVVHPKKVSFKGPLKKFKPPISIIGVVPKGLQHVGVMTIPKGIIGYMASEIPVSTIILLLEHIAISKSFGRVNDYKVIPDQEVIAIGVNNLIGTFFNAYPSTGSFSRSALKAKCGVRTPFAGIFTGCVVLLALYALTATFYYIPKATLCAVIIHAVSDLIADYKVTLNFWNISPLDAGIFIIAVIITVFASIEDGVYFAICASVAVVLFRLAIPKGQFLGRIQVAEVINPTIDALESDQYSIKQEEDNHSGSSRSSSDNVEIHQVINNGPNAGYKLKKEDSTKDSTHITTRALLQKNPKLKFHTRWVPLTKENINGHLKVQPPPPGVIVFKPVEAFIYPNSSRQIDRVSDEAKRLTKRGKPYNYTDTGSRPWNDPGPLRWRLPFWKEKFASQDEGEVEDTRPVLTTVHFDFSSVTSIDVTSIHALVDLRKALNKYADREIEFHFSGILSPWIRRGLLNAGFGTYAEDGLVSTTTYVNIATGSDELETGIDGQYYAAVATNTPFLHLDIPDYR